MVFAFTIERPEAEAIIVHEDVSWPIRHETTAYDLAKRIGAPGFWRLKTRKPAEPTA